MLKMFFLKGLRKHFLLRFTFLITSFSAERVIAQELKVVLPIGHSNGIVSVQLTPDGKKAFAYFLDGVAVWDMDNGVQLKEFGKPEGTGLPALSPDGSLVGIPYGSVVGLTEIKNIDKEVLIETPSEIAAITFSSDSRKLAAATSTGIFIYDVQTRRQILKLQIGSALPVNYLRFDNKNSGIVYIQGSNVVYTPLDKSGVKRAFTEKEGMITGFVLSGDGKRMVIANHRNEYTILDVATFKQVSVIKGDPNLTRIPLIHPFSLSNDGGTLVFGTTIDIQVWDVNTRSKKNSFSVPRSILTINYIPGKELIISTDRAGSGNIWSSKGELIASLGQSQLPISSVDFSGKNNVLVAGSFDRTVKVWDVSKWTLLHELKGRAFIHHAVYASNVHSPFFTACHDGSVKVWDYKRTTLRKTLWGHTGIVTDVSSDGENFLVSSSTDSTAIIWDYKTYSLLKRIKGHKAEVTKAILSPDSRMLATASYDGSIMLWEVASGKGKGSLNGHNGPVKEVRFSPDGKKLLSISFDKTLRIWQLDSATDKILFETSTWINSARFSKDGRTILVSTPEAIIVIDSDSGTILKELKEQLNMFEQAIFSLTNHTVFYSTAAGKIYEWDFRSVREFTGSHKGSISSIAAVNDSLLVTTSYDRTCKTWNVTSKKMEITFTSLDSSEYIFYLPSGHYSSSKDASRLIYYVTPDQHTVSFDQLDARWNRPDKVLSATGLADNELVKLYRGAYLKRAKKLGIDTADLNGSKMHLPETSIINAVDFKRETTKETIELRFRSADQQFSLERFNVWVNGSPLLGSRGISLKERHLKLFDTSISIKLTPGQNIIDASVINSSGVESLRKPFRIFGNIPAATEKLYFFGIGLDRYSDSSKNLNYSAKDVLDFNTYLKGNASVNVVSKTFLNHEVKRSILDEIEAVLLTASESDKVIILYSGHGLISRDNLEYYLSTFDVDFLHPSEKGISYEDLESLMGRIKPRKKLILIDACHSGEIDKEEMQELQLIELSIQDSGVKSGRKPVLSESGYGVRNTSEVMQSLFNNLDRKTGTTVISAAAATQFALEKATLQNGVFTFSVMEYMKSQKSPFISGLKKYVNTRVSELTGGTQVPTARSENLQFDWALW